MIWECRIRDYCIIRRIAFGPQVAVTNICSRFRLRVKIGRQEKGLMWWVLVVLVVAGHSCEHCVIGVISRAWY